MYVLLKCYCVISKMADSAFKKTYSCMLSFS